MEAVWSVYRSTKRTAVDNSEKELACTKTDICSTKESFDTENSDKIYQLLAHGRWFSPGTPASSTTNTGRHDIAEILLKVALSTKINQPNSLSHPGPLYRTH
jgi:hypothetical protein